MRKEKISDLSGRLIVYDRYFGAWFAISREIAFQQDRLVLRLHVVRQLSTCRSGPVDQASAAVDPSARVPTESAGNLLEVTVEYPSSASSERFHSV